jgi:type IV pilus assembly protein PilA
MSASPAGESRSTAAVILITGVVAFAAIALLGVLMALAIYGVRKYVMSAKLAEGRAAVTAIAQGIGRCSTPRGYVPRSSRPIPADLAQVSGRKYQSNAAEWSQEPFVCAAYTRSEAQYFQYQWLSEGDVSGVARAEADFDGDGKVDVRFEMDVLCGATGCQAARQVRETVH